MKKVISILAISVGLVIFGFVLWIVGFLILIATGVIPLFGTRHIDKMNDPEIRQRVEQSIGVVFPDTIQWQKSLYFSWQGYIFYAKFRIPESDLEPLFEKQRNGQWYENDRSKLNLSYFHEEEWMPLNELSDFKVFESIFPGHYLQAIIDMDSRDEEDYLTVYIRFCNEYYEMHREKNL